MAVVAEVTNTPWGEKHCYVIPCSPDYKLHHCKNRKQFHVSPFMPMDMHYAWALTTPDTNLTVRIENHDTNECVFDVAMHLQRREFSTAKLMWAVARFPFMTVRVVLAIYWQAFRLWWKRVAFVPHPNRVNADAPAR